MAAQTGGIVVTIDDVALRVSAALGTAGVPFMLVGGFSSNYHGIPRSTKDADFVVQLSAPLNQAFAPTLGPEFDLPALGGRARPGMVPASSGGDGRWPTGVFPDGRGRNQSGSCVGRGPRIVKMYEP